MNKSIGGVVADLKKYALQHFVKTSLALAALVGVAVFYQNCGLERPQVDLASMGQLGYFAHTGKEETCVPCHEARRPNAAAVPSILNVALNKSPNRFSHVDAYNGASDCVYCHSNDTKKIGNTWVASGYYDHTDNAGAYVTSCKDCHAAPLATPSTTPSLLDHATDANVIAKMALTGDCFNCHTKQGSSWASANHTHNLTADTATMCNTCHIGKMPVANVLKPNGAVKNMFFHNSISVGTAKTMANDCAKCHAAAAAGFPSPVITDWAGGIFNHIGSTGTVVTACASCHGTATSTDRPQPTGTLVGSTAYQFNHAAFETKECSTCHKTTTRNTASPWNDGKYNHLPVPTSCNGCHDQNRPLEATAFVTRPTATNPLLASQSATTYWHKEIYGAGLTGDCYGCHTNNKAVIGKVGSWVNSGYFDHTNAAGAKITTCTACHAKPTSTLKYNHSAVVNGVTECAGCHGSAGISWSAAGSKSHSSNDLGKCAGCHAPGMPNASMPVNTLYTLATPATKNFFVHDVKYVGQAPTPTTAPPYVNDCSGCHSYPTATVNKQWKDGYFDHKLADTKSAAGVTTVGATVTSCAPCHTKTTGSDRPVGAVGFNLTGPLGIYKYNHANGLANATATDFADCASCHKAPTTATQSWANGNYTHSPTPLACVACHKQVPLATTQLPATKTIVDRVYFHNVLYNGTSDCVKCHGATILNVGNTWAGAIYDHTGAGATLTTPVTTCLACHSASVDRVNVVNGKIDGFVHSATYVSDCKGCHTPHNTNTPATLVGGAITANAGWWKTITPKVLAKWKDGPNGTHKTPAGATVTSCVPCHELKEHKGGEGPNCTTSNCHTPGRGLIIGVSWGSP